MASLLEIVKDPQTWLSMFDEFLVSFVFLLVIETNHTASAENQKISTDLKIALLLIALLYNLSRANVTSAISFSRYISGLMDGISLVGYLLAQILSAFVVLAIFRDDVTDGDLIHATYTADTFSKENLKNLIKTFLASFILVSFSISINKKCANNQISTIAIGLTYLICFNISSEINFSVGLANTIKTLIEGGDFFEGFVYNFRHIVGFMSGTLMVIIGGAFGYVSSKMVKDIV